MPCTFASALRRGTASATLLAALAVPAAAQQVDVRTEVHAAGEATLLPEVRAELATDDAGEAVEVRRVAAAAERTPAYAQVDLATGDRILAIAGKRVRSVEAFREAYDALGIGDSVELGVQRGDRRWIERFAKADPAGLPQVRRMEIRFEGNPEDIALLMGLGVVLGKQDDDTFQVIALMPGEASGAHFEKGDTVVSVNGQTIDSGATLQELWSTLPVGSEVAFETRRGGEKRTFSVVKPEFRGRVVTQ